jgi:hypothetical protein
MFKLSLEASEAQVHLIRILWGIPALSGCIAPYQYATGLLDVSPSVESGLRQWADKTSPGTFAVSKDGRTYGYSYCRDVRCAGDEEAIALYSCEQRSKDDCIIYAKGGRYIWNDEKVK